MTRPLNSPGLAAIAEEPMVQIIPELRRSILMTVKSGYQIIDEVVDRVV